MLTTFLNRFVNRQDCHYQQRSGGGYFLVKEPITDALLQQHLDGAITLGVPSVSEQQTCRWVCFDDDTDETQRLDWIEMLCDNDCLNPLKEGARDGRAGHLWLFFDQPLSVATAYDFGQIIKRTISLESLRLSGQVISVKELEFFPKQRTMKEGSIGNCVKMPLGIHKKLLPTIWRPSFANCESQMVEDQLQWFAEQPLSSAQTVIDLVSRTPVAEIKSLKNTKPKTSGDLLAMVPEWYPLVQLPSGEYQTRCPVCAQEGHDKSGNNLNIDSTGNLMCCHYGNRQHRFVQILQAFRQLRQQPIALT